LDPVPREVVRDAEDEAAVVQRDAAGLTEPRPIRRFVEGASEPTGNFVPQTLRGQLDLMLHPGSWPPARTSASAHPTKLPKRCKCAGFAGGLHPSRIPPHLWRTVGVTARSRFPAWTSTVEKSVDRRRLYCAAVSPFFHDEAHLPAQRPPPQAQARLPFAHADACRAADPEAASRQGPHEALRVAAFKL